MSEVLIAHRVRGNNDRKALEGWRVRLKAGARRMLDVLIDRHPDGMTRQELADAAEIAVTGGTFSTYLGMLRTAGLMREDGVGIYADDVLFLGAAQ